MKKTNINDLYFGYVVYRPYMSGESLKEENLFGCLRVLWSVAYYVANRKKFEKGGELENSDPLAWCFGDTRGRAEYECLMSPWLGSGESVKVDVYKLYVEPNRELLLGMLDNVSVSSAKRYLADERKRLKGKSR